MMGMCSEEVGTKTLNLGFVHPVLFSWRNVALQEASEQATLQLAALVRGWQRHHSCAGGEAMHN